MKKMCLLAVFFLCTTINAHAFMGFLGGSPKEVTSTEGVVVIDTSTLKNEQSTHYFLRDKGNTIRFFVVRDKQGVVRAAIDACEVCYESDKGYKFDTNVMICVNCGQKFALHNIGKLKGGCNPHPIQYDTTDKSIRIPETELLQNAHYFPKNRP